MRGRCTDLYRHIVRGIEAVGRGTDKDDAKSDAAKKVYEYFLRHGVPANEEPELLTSVISIG